MIALHVLLVFLYVFSNNFNLTKSYIAEPGPTIKATKGEVWPKPQEQTSLEQFYILRPQAFEFRVIAKSCGLLENALQRYIHIINTTIPQSRYRRKGSVQEGHYYKPWRSDKNFIGYLDSLDVLLVEPCEDNQLPTETMNEKYILNVTSDSQHLLSATTIWGILRGLETFSQLMFPTDEEALQINCTTIYDYPRFAHRGLLLDTSRHFIPVPKILKTLDAMSYNKLNVFHWHITDDQSFPYQSLKYPELSEKGAYLDSYVYSSSDVQKIISYAAARGIRVMVEFDTPGHTRSWGEAFPELLTPCYNKSRVLTGQYGPMDPTKQFTYDFLKDFFDEVIRVFPEQYLHLGGDEVEFECWQSNPDINNFMERNNISTYAKLEDYYIQKLLKIIDNLKARSIVWEEVFVNGVELPNTTIVHVWRTQWQSTMYEVTKAGFPALLSACWYLDHLATGGDWFKYYDCDPYDFVGTDEQKKLILGGEACMWAEVVNEFNVESRVWPRASAPAEKLWSPKNTDVAANAARRLEEHSCRMNKRGILAQPPNHAGFCEL